MMGEMASGVQCEYPAVQPLMGAHGSHNSDLAELILRQQLIAHSDEVRGRSSDHTLQMSGGGVQSARFPHQAGGMLTGEIPTMLLLDTTRPPEMPTERGFLRRLAVVKFNKTQMGDEKERPDPTERQKGGIAHHLLAAGDAGTQTRLQGSADRPPSDERLPRHFGSSAGLHSRHSGGWRPARDGGSADNP